ncbi:MAG: hypothetical protein ACKOIB_06060, partial [Verrucomicrobiota bacterium]
MTTSTLPPSTATFSSSSSSSFSSSSSSSFFFCFGGRGFSWDFSAAGSSPGAETETLSGSTVTTSSS